jgi:hypothetical protein
MFGTAQAGSSLIVIEDGATLVLIHPIPVLPLVIRLYSCTDEHRLLFLSATASLAALRIYALSAE